MKRALLVSASLLLCTHVASAQPDETSAEEEAPTEGAAAEEAPADAEAADEGAASEAEAGDESGKKAANEDALPEPGEGDSTHPHAGQFGIRAGLVGGYRMVFRYDESPFCAKPDLTEPAKEQQKFCGHGAPMATEVALSFAPIDSVEPYLFGRFGLQGEPETNTAKLMVVGVGARLYTMSDSAFKVFIEPALGWELEGGAGNPDWGPAFPNFDPEYKKDVVFHLAVGPQFDVADAVGLYLDAGLSVGILRAIHSTLEVHGGVQVRVP